MRIDEKSTSKKNSKHHLDQLKLHLHATPQQYRGIHLLGNFPETKGLNCTLEDHRVIKLHHSLFKNKRVLDVGSGNGRVAVEIAIRYFPRKIIALDIDRKNTENAHLLAQKITERN